jgi:hypothetical protein
MKRAYDQQSFQAQSGAVPPANPPPNGQVYSGYNYYQPTGNAAASTSQQYNPAFPFSTTAAPAPGQPPLPPGAPPPAPSYEYSSHYPQQTGQTKLAQPQGPAQRPDPAFANYGYSASTQQAHQQAAQYPHSSMCVVTLIIRYGCRWVTHDLAVLSNKRIPQRSRDTVPNSPLIVVPRHTVLSLIAMLNLRLLRQSIRRPLLVSWPRLRMDLLSKGLVLNQNPPDSRRLLRFLHSLGNNYRRCRLHRRRPASALERRQVSGVEEVLISPIILRGVVRHLSAPVCMERRRLHHLFNRIVPTVVHLVRMPFQLDRVTALGLQEPDSQTEVDIQATAALDFVAEAISEAAAAVRLFLPDRNITGRRSVSGPLCLLDLSDLLFLLVLLPFEELVGACTIEVVVDEVCRQYHLAEVPEEDIRDLVMVAPTFSVVDP